MRILVVGGGGREHALCWALRREDPHADLYAAPGNPGTADLATNLPIAASDLDRLADAADAYGIDLVIVGPEAPLADGLADRLRAEGRAVFGPGAAAAQVEASKAFAKALMGRAGVPTAASATFTDLADALRYVDAHAEPLVVKASGLAAGKGAVVCATRAEAAATVRAMLGEGKFGGAGRVVVIEDFLAGEELSVFAVTNGREVRILPAAQDHKRLLEGDQGPNTGGMGAYSPVSLATPELLRLVEDGVLLPTLRQLESEDTPFVGLLYAGLMISPDGEPSVVEFNCRFGDPETQVVLPLVERGLTDLLFAAARREALPRVTVGRGAAVTTVLAARGYPDAPEKGAVITIPDELPDGVTVFHAGTTRDDAGVLRVAGGRVLNVTAVAPSFPDAQAASRAGAEAVAFDGKVWRRDIGWREADRLGG
ncbi:MAG TPA: phosphoribosylamine--glycine ligase [Gemmatimonadales bacterium]|nr:phosphoribosylamine--glycine ligase [Gemmatimonadales bacterium]